jgi:hypothetical protein
MLEKGDLHITLPRFEVICAVFICVVIMRCHAGGQARLGVIVPGTD